MRKKIIGILSILFLAYLIGGCAATSKSTSEKNNEAKQFNKIPDKGVVYLYRPGRMVGAANQTQIKINGQDAGGTGPGTFFRWELEPGTYVFSCYTSESSAVVELNIEPNKLYFLRQDTRLGVSGGRVSLKVVDESTGKEAVKQYDLLVSTYK